jgi:hypothetical protein
MKRIGARFGGQFHPASYEPRRRNTAGNMLLPMALAWMRTCPFTRKDGERKGSPSC